MHDRPCLVPDGSADGKSVGADRGGEQGKARVIKGHLSAQGFFVVDHGCWRARGNIVVLDARPATAVIKVLRANRKIGAGAVLWAR